MLYLLLPSLKLRETQRARHGLVHDYETVLVRRLCDHGLWLERRRRVRSLEDGHRMWVTHNHYSLNNLFEPERIRIKRQRSYLVIHQFFCSLQAFSANFLQYRIITHFFR